MKKKVFIMAMTACLIGTSMGTTGVTMAQAAEENSVEIGNTEAEEGVEENQLSSCFRCRIHRGRRRWNRTTRKSQLPMMKKQG